MSNVKIKQSKHETLVEDKLFFLDDSFKLLAYETGRGIYQKAFHEEIEIKCCYEGSYNVLIDSKVHTVKKGDVVVINPYEVHENISNLSQDVKCYVLIFSVDVCARLACDFDLRDLFFVKNKRFKNIFCGNERLCEIIKNIVVEREEKKNFHSVVERGLLLQLIAILMRDGLEDGYEDYEKVKGKETVVQALSLIHNNYGQKLTVEQMASACLVSVSTFLRVFKSVTGVTPIKYLIQYRMNIANSLLHNTNKTCEEISEICGFEDATYFNKLYKKMHGVSPNKARRK